VSTAPPGKAIWPLCDASASARREKTSEYAPSESRTIGISTAARRCCGALISMAGRSARMARSRSSARSSKRGGMPGLRLEHRNTFDGVVEPKRRAAAIWNGDRGRFPRPKIARQFDPTIVDLTLAVEELGDHPIRRLSIHLGAQHEIAVVLDREAIPIAADDLEQRKERNPCSADALAGARRRGRRRYIEYPQIPLHRQLHPRIRFQPFPLRLRNRLRIELAGEEVDERLNLPLADRNLRHA